MPVTLSILCPSTSQLPVRVMPVCSLNGFLSNSDLEGKGMTTLAHFFLTCPVQTRFQDLSLVLRSLNPDTSDPS